MASARVLKKYELALNMAKNGASRATIQSQLGVCLKYLARRGFRISTAPQRLGHISDTPEGIRSKTRQVESGCWLWMGSRNPVTGYGHVVRSGKLKYAHRLSFEIFKGPIPAGKHICHTCGTPICVNPDHLYAGTPKDNAMDRERMGRGRGRRPRP